MNVRKVFCLAAGLAVWFASTLLGFLRVGSVGEMLAALMFDIDRDQRLRLMAHPNAKAQLIGAEVFLVFLGAAQWGYGDLFLCRSKCRG